MLVSTVVMKADNYVDKLLEKLPKQTPAIKQLPKHVYNRFSVNTPIHMI